MTREEAINRLTNTLQEMRAFFFDSKHISEDDEKDLASMEMAIKALEQEPCEDCISRKRLKECFHKNVVGSKVFDELIDMQPSVNPQEPKWIPVSERLPKSAGVYIVSRWFSDGFESMILTDACYFDGTSTWHNDNRINHSRDYVDKKIVAWMPLPEPMKAESEE